MSLLWYLYFSNFFLFNFMFLFLVDLVIQNKMENINGQGLTLWYQRSCMVGQTTISGDASRQTRLLLCFFSGYDCVIFCHNQLYEILYFYSHFKFSTMFMNVICYLILLVSNSDDDVCSLSSVKIQGGGGGLGFFSPSDFAKIKYLLSPLNLQGYEFFSSLVPMIDTMLQTFLSLLFFFLIIHIFQS